jgi:hypothetical protein
MAWAQGCSRWRRALGVDATTIQVIEQADFGLSNGCPEVVPTASWLVYCVEAAYCDDVGKDVLGGELAGRRTPVQVTSWRNEMSRVERHQPRHLDDDLAADHRARVRWVSVAGLVVVVVLLVLAARALTRTTPVQAVRDPAPAAAPASATASSRPVLSDDCRTVLAAATRMISHADAVAANLRGHKQLMDDYKSGKIDRATAIPQNSPWRQALARTLKQGGAAADQYDIDKATYRKLAAQCSNRG